MSHVPPIDIEPSFFERKLDVTARGMLREDMRNDWSPDEHALSNLVAGGGSTVLVPASFDQLLEDNKYIVVALASHVLRQLSERYIRKVPADEVPENVSLSINYPVMYVSDEGLAERILQLARIPGSDGASVLNPAAAELKCVLFDAVTAGNLVNGGNLERLLQHAKEYSENTDRTKSRRPVTNADDLDSDDMHAFLAAYKACFPSDTA